MPNRTAYHVSLMRGGIAIPEMLRLLRAYGAHGDWQRLRAQVFQENLLGKMSQKNIQALLGAFRRRFLVNRCLPPALLP